MAETQYVLETTYKIKYTNENPVPIAEIIDSLLALEKIIRRTPKFVERYYKGIKITSTEVFVSSVEAGSLKEEFVIRFVFKTKENYDQAKELAAKILGDNQVVKTIVALGVGAIIGAGMIYALPDGTQAPTIEAYNNTIINIGADINFSAADIKATLGALPPKAVAREAIQAVRPAKLEPGSHIEMEELPGLDMPSKFVKESPYKYEPPMPSEKSSKYKNVEIFIHASDRDNNEKGWGGIVPELFEHRVKFVLADNVDPSKLHGRIKARADLEVHEKFAQDKKKYVVTLVEIQGIN